MVFCLNLPVTTRVKNCCRRHFQPQESILLDESRLHIIHRHDIGGLLCCGGWRETTGTAIHLHCHPKNALFTWYSSSQISTRSSWATVPAQHMVSCDVLNMTHWLVVACMPWKDKEWHRQMTRGAIACKKGGFMFCNLDAAAIFLTQKLWIMIYIHEYIEDSNFWVLAKKMYIIKSHLTEKCPMYACPGGPALSSTITDTCTLCIGARKPSCVPRAHVHAMTGGSERRDFTGRKDGNPSPQWCWQCPNESGCSITAKSSRVRKWECPVAKSGWNWSKGKQAVEEKRSTIWGAENTMDESNSYSERWQYLVSCVTLYKNCCFQELQIHSNEWNA